MADGIDIAKVQGSKKVRAEDLGLSFLETNGGGPHMVTSYLDRKDRKGDQIRGGFYLAPEITLPAGYQIAKPTNGHLQENVGPQREINKRLGIVPRELEEISLPEGLVAITVASWCSPRIRYWYASTPNFNNDSRVSWRLGESDNLFPLIEPATPEQITDFKARVAESERFDFYHWFNSSATSFKSSIKERIGSLTHKIKSREEERGRYFSRNVTKEDPADMRAEIDRLRALLDRYQDSCSEMQFPGIEKTSPVGEAGVSFRPKRIQFDTPRESVQPALTGEWDDRPF